MKEQEIFLRLDSSYKIKYEEIDQFSESLFSEVYMQAVKTVNEIQEKNEKYHQDRKSGNAYRNKEQIYNIISFIGGRGTGKTSAMLSFAEYLKDYYRKRDSIDDSFRMKKSFFIGVDFIDAGLLEKEEDLIEIVLARMLHKLSEIELASSYKEPDYEYKRKEFYQELRQIYNNLKSLNEKQTNTYWRQESSLDDLLQLSVSYNLRESMKKLVEKYLDLGCTNYIRDNVRMENRFLVIPIDDVDMLVEKGYMMVEQIRRYLMIPNVIVLLSFDYKQLMHICKCHYMKGFSEGIKNLGSDSLKSEKKEVLKWAEQLSKQYLDKMIPDGRQIYLPSLGSGSYFVKRKIRILPEKSLEDKNEDKKNSCEIQELILYSLARSTNIYFYGNLKETHFLEPKSLRKLSNYCYVLRSLEKKICFYPGAEDAICLQAEVGKADEEFRRIQAEEYRTNFGRNYTWLLKDLYYRMYKIDRLPETVRDALDQMQGEGLEAQLDIMMNALWKSGLEEENADTFFALRAHRAMPSHENSLGDFMRFLYQYQSSIQPNLRMLLLAYFSAVVSGKLYLDRLEGYEHSDKHNFETVEELGLTNSFGSWDEEVLNWESEHENEDGKKNRCILGKEKDFQIKNNWKLKLEVSCKSGKNRIEINDENKKAIKNLEMNLLFFDRYRQEGVGGITDIPGWVFEKTLSLSEDKTKLYCEFTLRNKYKARYQVSNFVKNIYRYDEILERLHEGICGAEQREETAVEAALQESPSQTLAEEQGNQDQAVTEKRECPDKKMVRAALNQMSIMKEFRKWEELCGTRMVIPVQNMELMYRILQKMVAEKPVNFSFSTRQSLLKQYFSRLEQELRSQTEFYQSIHQVESEPKYRWKPVDFGAIYKECPLIKNLLLSSEKESQDSYLAYLVRILEDSQTLNEQIMEDAEEIKDE